MCRKIWKNIYFCYFHIYSKLHMYKLRYRGSLFLEIEKSKWFTLMDEFMSPIDEQSGRMEHAVMVPSASSSLSSSPHSDSSSLFIHRESDLARCWAVAPPPGCPDFLRPALPCPGWCGGTGDLRTNKIFNLIFGCFGHIVRIKLIMR